MNKSVRITQLSEDRFRLDVVTALPTSRTAILNLTDSVQTFDDLTFEELVAQLRAVFVVVAHP